MSIETIDRLGTIRTEPDEFGKSYEQVLADIYQSRIERCRADLARICQDRAKQLLDAAVVRIDYADLSGVAMECGPNAEELEPAIRQWLAEQVTNLLVFGEAS